MPRERRISEVDIRFRFPEQAKELLTLQNGFWICAIEPQSLKQLISQNPDFFRYIVPDIQPRKSSLSEAFEVAIPIDSNEHARPIAESDSLLPEEQSAVLEEYNRAIEIPGVKAIIGHTSIVAQSIINYQHERHFRVRVIKGFCVCTHDGVGNDYRYACISQYENGQLCVGSWFADEQYSRIQVLPIIVPAGLEI